MYASLKSFFSWPPSRDHLRWLSLLLCSCSTLASVLVYWLGRPLPLGLLVINVAALACIWMQYGYSRKSIRFQPQELAERLLEVKENERHRLSRELHDDIGQLLTAAKLQTDWLKRRLPDELQEHCAVLGTTLEETLAKVRDVSAILNPRQLASLGLEASLRAHLLKTLENTSVHWSLECHQRLAGIPEEMAVAAFRITQEAVTNILRHAQAKNLLVRLQRLPEGLSLFISDDGQGFAPASDPGAQGQRGMAGMQERISQLGGLLKVTSEADQGTQIEALFPWAPRTLERASTNKVFTLTCNLLLVDDHSLIRAGVRALVMDIPGYAVIGEADDGSFLLEMVERLHPDIILLDLSMKHTGGLDALRRLKALHPQSKVLILSMHTDPALIMQALECGAHGYLLKDTTATELEHALQALRNNERYLSPAIAHTVINQALTRAQKQPPPPEQNHNLTARQLEILRLIVRGKSTREIALGLGLSIKTVETHRSQIMKRLQIFDVAGLVLFAVRERIISLDD